MALLQVIFKEETQDMGRSKMFDKNIVGIRVWTHVCSFNVEHTLLQGRQRKFLSTVVGRVVKNDGS